MQHDHPDAVDLELGGNEAAGWFHYAAICYSSRNLTDGFVSNAALAKLTANRAWRKHVQLLIDAGWFIEVEGGIQISHYTDYQSTRAEVEARRERDAERKAAARAAKSGQLSAQCPSGTNAGQDAESEQCPPLVPIPIQAPKETYLDHSTGLSPFPNCPSTPQPVESARASVSQIRHAKGATPEQIEAFEVLAASLGVAAANPDRFKSHAA